jgi:hypothetical protein
VECALLLSSGWRKGGIGWWDLVVAVGEKRREAASHCEASPLEGDTVGNGLYQFSSLPLLTFSAFV